MRSTTAAMFCGGDGGSMESSKSGNLLAAIQQSYDTCRGRQDRHVHTITNPASRHTSPPHTSQAAPPPPPPTLSFFSARSCPMTAGLVMLLPVPPLAVPVMAPAVRTTAMALRPPDRPNAVGDTRLYFL